MLLAVSLTAAAVAGMKLFRTGYRMPDRNVIFVSIDTLRADRLGCYGYDRQTSPNIDRFARENLLFMNTMVPITQTLPSHTSMLTGLHPKTHGVIKNGLILNDDLITLPEILKERGYVTAGIVSGAPLNSDRNFHQGFDHYSDVKKGRKADYLLKRALPWIQKHRDEKFFLFLHFMDPHSPYKPPPEFRKWGKDDNSLYDGEVLYVDHAMGKIFETLKKYGLYSESLIIVTSDHGESLGEHSFWGHDRSLYEECLRVPLIIHLPDSLGVEPAVYHHLTSAVDFMPTMIKLLDLDADIYTEGLDLFGKKAKAREYVMAQRRYFEGQNEEKQREIDPSEHFEYGDKYAVRTMEKKYLLLTRDDDELYDLAEDPGELNNLLKADDPRERDTGFYPKLIESWLADTPYTYETDLNVSDEVKERLKSLGYIN
jgi:arylsulfatase A-like enzyme